MSNGQIYNLIGKRKNRNGGVWKLIFWGIIIIFSILGISKVLAADNDHKPLVDSFNFTDDWSFNFADHTLQPQIKDYLKDKEGSYAVYIEALEPKDEQIVKLNSTDPFPAASLYKLFLMAAVENSLETGELKEDQALSAKINHLEDVVGPEFGYEDYDAETLSYTVSEALTRVATVSDNYAAILLAEKVGWEKVRAQAKQLGAQDTSIKDPITTTAFDIGLFFKKLYLKQVVSENVSNKIIDLLALSRLNDRIPALLPDELKVIHKTGELSKVRNDAGVVYLEGKPYVIVILSKDVTHEDNGVEALAQVSKMSYDYLREH